MAINSRNKGNKGERKAAALFKTWTGKEFARTPSSGGLSWKSSNSKGDVVCTSEGHYFPFVVEIKTHKEIDFSHLLVPGIKNVKILEFWEQADRDAKKANKIPMLLMRYDRLPADFYFLVVTQEFAKLCHVELTSSIPGFTSLRYHNYKTNQALMVFSSKEFFMTNYKTVKKIAKTYLKEKYGCQK